MPPQPVRLEKLTRFESNEFTESGLLEVIVKYNGDLLNIGALLGADIELLSPDYAIITLPVDRLAELYGFPQIEFIELPKVLTFMLRNSLESACVPPVQRPDSFGLTGAGVIVGIIDSGIDYTHPDFRNPDGSTRILYLWDQTAAGSPPAGFRSGVEYSSIQIDEALASPNPRAVVPSVDTAGHGTAVAGIAAGNGASSGGVEVGVAPKASLIVVKLGHTGNESFTRTTEIMRGVKYLSDKALALNMPLSINLSYGTNNGSHTGDSLFERYLNSMCERWKTVMSVATGNEGGASHHYHGKLSANETSTIEFAVTGLPRRLYMTLWKNFADTVTYELLSPSGRSTGIIQPLQSVTQATLDGTDVSIIYAQPNHYTVQQEVYFLFSTLGTGVSPGVWRLIARAGEIVDGEFNIWLPTVEDVTRNTAFLRADVNLTLTLPSTVQNVISVGGYNAMLRIATVFSGRGALGENGLRIKPDLVAPSVSVLTTRAGGGYDAYTGTSMASPFVTGAAALMMEWGIVMGNDPFLYGQRVKAFLRKSANRQFSAVFPSNQWGYGALSVCEAMGDLVEYTRTGGAFS